jgi:GTP-binding protein EngB required for normal cell division
MTSLLGWRRRRGADLGDRLAALTGAAATLAGRVDQGLLDRVRDLDERAGTRASVGVDRTVVALAGSTGSGKSSLFNAVVGFDLAATGVRRPTTAEPLACVWGAEGSEPLLEWLQIPPAHRVARESELGPAPKNLRGLVLLDLPDHDSLVSSHRAEVDRLVGLVDLLVWVVDPQKYADALLHEEYLRRMTAYGAVVVVVLNQVDRLDPQQRTACAEDLRRLLERDGLADVPVQPVSAVTGEGLGGLHSLLERAVRTRRTATERLAADVSALAWDLASAADLDDEVREGGRPVSAAEPDEDALVDRVSAAVGVDALGDVVAAGQRRRAQDTLGWPGSRLLRRVTGAPAAAMGEEVVALAVTDSSAVVQARVDLAVRQYVTTATGDLPEAWARRAQARVDPRDSGVAAALQRAAVDAAAQPVEAPRWWTLQRAAQGAAMAVAGVGLVWLLGLLVLGIGRVDLPAAPTVGGLPWPGVLLLAGTVASLVLSLIVRSIPDRWGRRAADQFRARAREQVRAGLEPAVVDPVRDERSVRDAAVAGLRQAAA